MDLFAHRVQALEAPPDHHEHNDAYKPHFDFVQFLRAYEGFLWLFVTQLVEEAFRCKTSRLVPEHISLKVNATTIYKSRGALSIAF